MIDNDDIGCYGLGVLNSGFWIGHLMETEFEKNSIALQAGPKKVAHMA